MNKKGFTIIELCVAIIFLIIVGSIFTLQKFEIDEKHRNDYRKRSINAIYFNLEEVFYKQNNFYPKEVSEHNLKGVDPQIFTDYTGKNIGNPESEFRYEPTNCDQDKCKSYTLRAKLEKEDDFVKESRN